MNLVLHSYLPMQSHVEEVEADVIRADLDESEDDPEDAQEEEKEEPPPQQEEHLVVDYVQAEDADSVDFLLPTT